MGVAAGLDHVALQDLLIEERVEAIPASPQRVDLSHGREYRKRGCSAGMTAHPKQPTVLADDAHLPGVGWDGHGDQDNLVIVDDARRFVEGLRATSCNPVVQAELPGAQHGFELFRSRRLDTVLDAIEAFAAWVTSTRQDRSPRTRPVDAALELQSREPLVIRCWHPSDASLMKEAVETSLTDLRAWMAWAAQWALSGGCGGRLRRRAVGSTMVFMGVASRLLL